MAERYLKITIAAGLFAGLALSPKLWLSERLFPLTPVWRFLRPIPPPLDAMLYAALLILLAVIAVVARPAKWIGSFALIVVTLALFDQSRWQPWLYQYLVMLLATGLYDYQGARNDDNRHPALNTCRLVIACIYMWSGLQKIHTDFVVRVFPWLIEPFTRSLPHSIAAKLNALGTFVPFVEIAIGIGLLTPLLRQYAVLAAIGMHAFILLAIGPLGRNWNQVVWPWNVCMILFVLILFWKRPNLSLREIVWPHGQPFQKLALVLFGIAPVLSFGNAWDDYLSSALYAGYRNEAVLQVTNSLADRLPKTILECVYLTDKPGTNAINLLHWSLNELNVANYPEPRIYKNVARYICSYARQPSEMKLIIKRSHMLFSPNSETEYDCPALLSHATW